ncbi:MAG: hypothetical protein ACRETX_16655 [Steroidobacteraceae bacterium]
MATKRSPARSKSHAGGRRKSKAPRSGIPARIEAAIETQRSRLQKAYALLRALRRAMLYADDDEDDPIAYSDVAAVAAELVDDAVDNLDSVCLAPQAELAEGRKRPK